jgi:hypothetical protein
MPARSKSQQRLMAMAYVCQKSGFKKCASEKITQLAQSMKEKDLKDFASTKTKNLPERKIKDKKVGVCLEFKKWLKDEKK